MLTTEQIIENYCIENDMVIIISKDSPITDQFFTILDNLGFCWEEGEKPQEFNVFKEEEELKHTIYVLHCNFTHKTLSWEEWESVLEDRYYLNNYVFTTCEQVVATIDNNTKY